jgi:hypothetical protein
MSQCKHGHGCCFRQIKKGEVTLSFLYMRAVFAKDRTRKTNSCLQSFSLILSASAAAAAMAPLSTNYLAGNHFNGSYLFFSFFVMAENRCCKCCKNAVLNIVKMLL